MIIDNICRGQTEFIKQQKINRFKKTHKTQPYCKKWTLLERRRLDSN